MKINNVELKKKLMNEEFTPLNTENDEFTLNNEDSDYKNLITRLKDISETIVLLEKTIFK